MEDVQEERCFYFCAGCGHQWEESFRVRIHVDRDGEEIDTFFHRGQPCTNPTLEAVCPRCGDLRVRVLNVAERSPVDSGS